MTGKRKNKGEEKVEWRRRKGREAGL